jgi:NAD(P)-dependent dehydrogenase (short-subunit alcohol dehydrogenase family)
VIGRTALYSASPSAKTRANWRAAKNKAGSARRAPRPAHWWEDNLNNGPMQTYSLYGRVAVVTGAARGIGAAIAEQLCELGATVVLADQHAEVEATAAGLKQDGARADWMTFDVTASEAVDHARDAVLFRHGKVDILVANAGMSYEKPAIEHTDDEWRRVMSVNLDGVFYCIRSFARPMLEAKSGAIVATSSIAGVKAVRPELHVGYDVSKAAVAHLCRVLGVEWAKSNVRVNAVGPGYTDTAMLAEVGRTRPDVMKVWLDDIPVGRLLDRREIAATVAFLVSDAARGITGQLVMVDGGYSAA